MRKYLLHVYGCQMNVSDAERIAAMLERLGFEKTQTENEANLIGVVACSVRQAPIDRIFGHANKWSEMKKVRETVTMLTGCVLAHDKPNMAKIFDYQFPITDVGKLPQILSESFGEDLTQNVPSLDEYFDVTPKYEQSFRAYVPISSGCNKFCTYCAVPLTRGGEISRAPDKILDEVRHLVERGCKEITLLGQNVNSYGWDFEGVSLNLPGRKVLTYKPNIKGELEVVKREVQNPMSFPQLLRTINDIPGDFWVRFLTSHPYDMSDELIQAVAENDKLTHYIHLPVQSGSNAVLKRMNRLYTIEHYRERAAKVRKLLLDAMMTTDIIVGFCGETEKEFEETRKIMNDVRYAMSYTAQYSPRIGTVSARMKDDVPAEEKKRRFEELNDLLRKLALENHRKLVGTKQRMLVEEYLHGKNIGHLKHGWKAHLPGENRIGQFVDVEVVAAEPWHVVVKAAQPAS